MKRANLFNLVFALLMAGLVLLWMKICGFESDLLLDVIIFGAAFLASYPYRIGKKVYSLWGIYFTPQHYSDFFTIATGGFVSYYPRTGGLFHIAHKEIVPPFPTKKHLRERIL